MHSNRTTADANGRAMYKWFRREINPKLTWDIKDWTGELLQFDSSAGMHLSTFWSNSSVEAVKSSFVKNLSKYVMHEMIQHVPAECKRYLQRVGCVCGGCADIIEQLKSDMRRILRNDKLGLGEVHGIGHVVPFGDLILKNVETHREYVERCKDLAFSLYKLSKEFRFGSDPRVLKIGYKYVLNGGPMEDFYNEFREALTKYTINQVIDGFYAGGPGNILQTLGERFKN